MFASHGAAERHQSRVVNCHNYISKTGCFEKPKEKRKEKTAGQRTSAHVKAFLPDSLLIVDQVDFCHATGAAEMWQLGSARGGTFGGKGGMSSCNPQSVGETSCLVFGAEGILSARLHHCTSKVCFARSDAESNDDGIAM